TMKNPDGREPSRVQMYILTHQPNNGNPINDNTKRIVSELKDVMSLQPNILEQGSSGDIYFPKSWEKTEMVMHAHMEKVLYLLTCGEPSLKLKSKKLLRKLKEMLKLRYKFYRQIAKRNGSEIKRATGSFQKRVISIPNPNDVQGDPRSSASNHLTDVDPNKHTKSKSRKHKTKKVKVEKDPNMPNSNDVQVSTSNHLTDVDPNKRTKR
ncbi:hypothetical protein TSUD_132900, partial [Trifolium subterraneum]